MLLDEEVLLDTSVFGAGAAVTVLLAADELLLEDDAVASELSAELSPVA